MEKSSTCLPSEGKSNNLPHVPTLGRVKEPSNSGKLRVAGKIRVFSFLPLLVEVSHAAWCGASGDEGRNYFRGESTINRTAAVLNRPHKATFNFFLTFLMMYSRNACSAEGVNGMRKHRRKIGTRLYYIWHDIRLCFEAGHTNLFLAGC
jgi:hypothetical protein